MTCHDVTRDSYSTWIWSIQDSQFNVANGKACGHTLTHHSRP